MLDALGQLTTSNAADSAISAASSPTAGDSSGFSTFMDEITASTALDTPPAPQDESERADMGQGWEAAEDTDYEDPALAVAGAEQDAKTQPAADEPVGESVEQSDSKAGEATLAEQVGAETGAATDASTTSAAMMEDLKAQSAQLTTANAPATEAEGAVVSNAQMTLDPAAAVASGSSGEGEDASAEAQAVQVAMDIPQTDAKSADQVASGESAESEPDGAMAGALEELQAQVQAEAQAAGAEMATEGTASADETAQAGATVSMPGVEMLDPTATTAGEAIAAPVVGQTDQVESPMAAMTATANAMAEAADDLPAPNVDQLASRTVRWRNVGILGQGGSARIRLDPPSLGTVEVTLRTSGQTVQVEMTVESEAVRNLLQGNSDRLAQSLQAHGMQADRIEVTVQTPADAQAEGEGQDDAGQQQPQQQQDPDAQDDDFIEQMEEELNVTA